MATQVFDHIIIVIFENQYRSYVMEQPYMRYIASQGVNLANYFGVTHPSQPNYIASIAGELCNVTSDHLPQAPLPQSNIVDLLEAKEISWKAYMESYPMTPWDPAWTTTDSPTPPQPPSDYPYERKHDPFSSFCNIQANQHLWAKIQNEDRFWHDVACGDLPQVSWYIPNMWNNGHDLMGVGDQMLYHRHILINQVAAWLENSFLGRRRLNFPGPNSRLPAKTLVVLTFDEGDYEGTSTVYDGPNQVYTVLLGETGLPAGSTVYEGYNHYSLLRTIEENFNLGTLGKNDAHANWFRFLWQEEMGWSPSLVALPNPPAHSNLSINTVPSLGPNSLAVAAYNNQVYEVIEANDTPGTMFWRTYNQHHGWSDYQSVGDACRGNLGLAVCGQDLVLVFQSPISKVIMYKIFNPAHGWLPTKEVGQSVGGRLALSSYNQGTKLMLVYQSLENSTLKYVTYNGQTWDQTATLVGYIGTPAYNKTQVETGGDIVLADLGNMILLVYQSLKNGTLCALTYGTASYNALGKYEGDSVINLYPQDDMVQNRWSVNPWPICHYPGTFDEPRQDVYRSDGALAMSASDGVVYLAYKHTNEPFIYITTFSVGGLLTSVTPNGLGVGTIKGVGWQKQSILGGSYIDINSAMAMTHYDSDAFLVFRIAASSSARSKPVIFYTIGCFGHEGHSTLVPRVPGDSKFTSGHF